MPDNVLKLIEDIKHFFCAKGCIFIIGVDRKTLSNGIEAKYGTKLINSDEYLEKIINISFSIPCNNNKHYIHQMAKRLTTNYENIIDYIEYLADIIITVGIDNPRRINTLIIRYLFFLTLDNHKGYIREIVLKLIIYRELFYEAYEEKKTNCRVDYFPKDPQNSCQDFIKISKCEKHNELRMFTRPTQNLIKFGFGKTSDEIRNDIKKEKDPGLKKLLKGLISSQYQNNHSDYFDIVDFVFSLSY